MEKSLAEVKLTEAAKIRASSYSGGMKRRLSVAIALIGEPKLIILDEPVGRGKRSKVLIFIDLYAFFKLMFTLFFAILDNWDGSNNSKTCLGHH